MKSLYELLLECAAQEGFPLAGGVDIDLALSDASGVFQKHVEHFDQWIQAGYAGTMDYLLRGRARRADPRLLFPGAQSVFCVALPYSPQAAGAQSIREGPRYARYLQGPDYHVQMTQKLQRMMEAVQAKSQAAPSLDWKVCVDTSAVLERTWAALAGLGWIGKNTLLIHPKYGSYLFLGEVLINLPIGRAPTLLPNYCGNCQRCLKGCPTSAFEKPGVLNSNRCISFLTLEKRGEMNLSEEQKKKIGPWIAGCDLCQEVCPFNLKCSRAEKDPAFDSNASATALNTWEALLEETPEQYLLRVKNSALKRVKPQQQSRNLAIVLKNALEALVLNEPDEELRSRIVSKIRQRFEEEKDESARAEWQLSAEFIVDDHAIS